MIKTPFEYLKNLDLIDVKALLCQVPGIGDFLIKKQISDLIRSIIMKIPVELLHEYHSTFSKESTKNLREWLSLNCQPWELHYMYKHFQLAPMGPVTFNETNTDSSDTGGNLNII